MGLHRHLAERQAQTSPASFLLADDELLEQLISNLGRNTGAGVDDGDEDLRPVRCVGARFGVHADHAANWRELDGVAHQVRQHAFDIAHIGPCWGQIGWQVTFQFNVPIDRQG